MSPAKHYAKKQAKARQRRRRTAQERLAHDRCQAQHAAKVVEQALHDLGLPGNLVAKIDGRLRSQQKLLGKIGGMMCSLGALPKRTWIKRLCSSGRGSGVTGSSTVFGP